MTVAVASTIWIGTLWTLAVRHGKTPEPLFLIGIGLVCGAGTAALTLTYDAVYRGTFSGGM